MVKQTSQEIIDQIKVNLGMAPVIEMEEEEPGIQTELFAEGKYLQITENYRRQISLTHDQKEKLILALRCIRDLTGDELFYKTNLKSIEGAESNDRKRKARYI